MFRDFCNQGKCDVCGTLGEVIVCGSSMGAVSFAYCERCFDYNAEPYLAMVAYISCAGHFPEDINEDYQKIVRNSLVCLGKTEEQFIEDVEECILDIEKHFH